MYLLKLNLLVDDFEHPYNEDFDGLEGTMSLLMLLPYLTKSMHTAILIL